LQLRRLLQGAASLGSWAEFEELLGDGLGPDSGCYFLKNKVSKPGLGLDLWGGVGYSIVADVMVHHFTEKLLKI
jgi:hypothetical protein